MSSDELLISAYELNLQNKFNDLAEDCLELMSEANANKLRNKLPAKEIHELLGSSIDWENHVNFGLDGRCFVCGRPFTREESKLMGIGPVCGDWSYSFDPHDPKNKARLEELKRHLRQKMLEDVENPYKDLLYYAPKLLNKATKITIIDERTKAVQIVINGITIKEFWIPRKACVFYFGAFFVQEWKAKEILFELVKRLN